MRIASISLKIINPGLKKIRVIIKNNTQSIIKVSIKTNSVRDRNFNKVQSNIKLIILPIFTKILAILYMVQSISLCNSTVYPWQSYEIPVIGFIAAILVRPISPK